MSKLSEEAAAFIKAAKKEAQKGKLQLLVEAEIGRELQDYEAIYWINGQPAVGLKPGVPYQYLQCSVCGNRLTRPSKPDMSDS